jgi:hypothetical protein
MSFQSPRQVQRQHRHPILGALTVAHRDTSISKIDILHSQPDTFHESQVAPVKQGRHQPRRAMQMRENLVNLIPVGDHWQTFRLSRPLNVIQPSDLFLSTSL